MFLQLTDDIQIKILPAVYASSRSEKTPQARKQIGASQSAPRISSNAFKALPPVLEDNLGFESEESPTAPHGAPSPNNGSPLASVTNVEKCPRSSSDASPTNSEAPTTKKAKGLQLEYRDGVEIVDKKPKASDYKDVVQVLILHVASEYECLVATECAFPDTVMRNKAWKNACIAADENYELSDRINSLVSVLEHFIVFAKVLNCLASQAGFLHSWPCSNHDSTTDCYCLWL